MKRNITIGQHKIGDGFPTYIIAEIGINHNGSLEIAKSLIDMAVHCGCNAVKFQKRTPELSVPEHQRNVMRETPWGMMTYLEYRYRVEFNEEQYREIDSYCLSNGLTWFSSVWDHQAVDFMEKLGTPCYKVPSALLTDKSLLRYIRNTGKPIIISTGMSTMEQIREAVNEVGTENMMLMHCTSTYPCKPEELNLKMIETLKKEFDVPIGYSGHEVGLVTTVAAVVLGAVAVERHITLDRSMWGSDQAASVEQVGLERLVKYIRTIESALGDCVKRVYEIELGALKRLRRVTE